MNFEPWRLYTTYSSSDHPKNALVLTCKPINSGINNYVIYVHKTNETIAIGWDLLGGGNRLINADIVKKFKNQNILKTINIVVDRIREFHLFTNVDHERHFISSTLVLWLTSSKNYLTKGLEFLR